MKRILATVILTAAGLMLASAPAYGQRHSKAGDHAIMEAEKAYVDALVKGDRAALNSILDEQYVFTKNEGDTLDRAAHLALFKGGTYRFATKADIDDVKIRMFGNTAIVTGRLNFVGHPKHNNQTSDGHSRYTHAWVKKMGHWRLVSNHSHRVG